MLVIKVLCLISAALPTLSLAVRTPNCRCLFGEHCWPGQADFLALTSELSQPLVRPSPPESSCYPSAQSAGCLEAKNKASNAVWRSDQVGSMTFPYFETFIFQNGTISGCYFNTTLGFPCGQGSVPPVGVDARTVQDVQAAVKFASKHNLHLVVKNTGHDFLGRSTAPGSFLVWTHHMKKISFNPSFVPSGAPRDVTYDAIILDAGVQWYEAYHAARERGRAVVGGNAGSVGASGGWVMGGGHSPLSAMHGLGVDNVIQFSVVTAEGEALSVNSYQHSDLFWAMRGGGGGTYAIVTSVVYKTHDNIPLSIVNVTATDISRDISRSISSQLVAMLPNLSDMGWAGYGFLMPEVFTFRFLAQNASGEAANKTLDPFIQFIRNQTAGNNSLRVDVSSFPSFNDYFSLSFDPETNAESGHYVGVASRFVYRDMANKDPGKVAEILVSLPEDLVGISLIAGGAVSKVDPDAVGVHPDWRKAVAHVYTLGTWNEGDSSSVIEKTKSLLRACLDIFSGLGRATYFNEASLYERNFKEAFFGPHYERLKKIKKHYDINDLFLVPSGVNSEDWDSSLNCRSRLNGG